MLSGLDPNVQKRQVLMQKGQFALRETDITTLNPYPEAVSGQRPMTIVDPTYDQIIIKPPKQNVTHGRIPVQQFVTSKDRNFTLYPEPGTYRVQLTDEYKNVTSVTLTSASIPNTSSLINKYNDQFCFQNETYDDECICITIPTADYSPQQLCAELQLLMNQAVAGNPYTVVANSLTNKFEIAKDLSDGCWFKLCFYGGSEKDDCRTRAVYPQNSIGPIIGYDRRDYLYVTGTVSVDPSDPTHIIGSGTKFLDELTSLQLSLYPAATLGAAMMGKVCFSECAIPEVHDILQIESDTSLFLNTPITDIGCVQDTCMIPWIHKAPNKFDLSSDSFIVLDIAELASNSSAGGNLVANAASVANAFAVIPMVFPHNTKNFVVSPFSSFPPIRRYYNPPIPRLRHLTVRFLDYNGNTVDFEGIDHFLEFRIVTINQPGHFDPEPF
jgi:hypothetical protein